jgi:hypothetical protein
MGRTVGDEEFNLTVKEQTFASRIVAHEESF